MIRRLAFFSLAVLLGIVVHATTSPPKATPTSPDMFTYGTPMPGKP